MTPRPTETRFLPQIGQGGGEINLGILLHTLGILFCALEMGLKTWKITDELPSPHASPRTLLMPAISPCPLLTLLHLREE